MNIERKLKWYFWRRLCFPKHLKLTKTRTYIYWEVKPHYLEGLKMTFQIGLREFVSRMPEGFKEDMMFAAFYKSYKCAQRRVKEENMTFIVRGKHIIKKETGEVVGTAKSEKAAQKRLHIFQRALEIEPQIEKKIQERE